MAKKLTVAGLTFSEACEYLTLSPDELTALREARLVACVRERGRQIYPLEALEITQKLLRLASKQSWSQETLAWFADLTFVAAIGRALLLPINRPEDDQHQLSASWLETPNLNSILSDFETALSGQDETFNNLLRSVVIASTGDGQFWSTIHVFQQSALYAIIQHFEALGHPILNQGRLIARDAAPIFGFMIMAFSHIAPPISTELTQLIDIVQPRLNSRILSTQPVNPNEQAVIQREALIAIDRLYVTKSPEIHSHPDTWVLQDGTLTAQRRSIQLVLRPPLEQIEQGQEIIDNILDLVRPYVGPFGARVIHLLYEIANDDPYWRTPLITVETNELLDRLGLKRTANGYHHSKNRERLRDVLNIAHYLEIVGEFPDLENGQQVTRALRRTVLSLIGATYAPEDRQGITTIDLFQKGLPRTIQVRLNFYDGVRQPDGRLGTKYVLMNRLAKPSALLKANYGATHEALKSYLLLRYRQLNMKSRILVITRQTALEKAHITNKNGTRATMTLRKALDHLVEDGTLESYTSDLPTKNHGSFDVTLSIASVTASPSPDEEHSSTLP